MLCDECRNETANGSPRDWMAGMVTSQQTYDTGTAIVGRTIYSAFTPVETFLCTECFEQRARRESRNWTLAFVGSLAGGIVLLLVSYNIWFWTFFIPGSQVPELPAWQVIVGVLSGLLGLFSLKLAWDQVKFGVSEFSAGSDSTANSVHHPYALAKAKAAGRDTVWDLKTYEAMH